MHNWQKVVLAILAIALIVGGRGIVLGTGSLHNREHREDAGVVKLVAEDSNADIELQPSGDNSLRISYGESRYIKYDITRNGDTLHVKMRDTRKWYDLFKFFGEGSRRLVIHVPAGLQSADLRTSNSDIVVHASLNLEQLKAGTSNGDLDISNVRANGTVALTTSNGNATLHGCSFPSNLVLTSSNGDLRVEQSTLQSATLKTSNAAIRLRDVTVPEVLSAHTSNGEIVLDRLTTDAGNLTLETSNGRIEGTIVGRSERFAITSKTSNSRNNLPAQSDGGPGKLRAITSNASINIDFRP